VFLFPFLPTEGRNNAKYGSRAKRGDVERPFKHGVLRTYS